MNLTRSQLIASAQKLLLLLVSVIFSLFIAEIITRQFVNVGSFRFESENQLDWKSEHEIRQYVLTPNYRGVLIAPEFQNKVEINSLGFRGPEETTVLRLNAEPIFVIGDSFVFGVGVEYKESIPAKVETYLKDEFNFNAQAWDLGAPGYATQQYIYALEEYLQYQTPSVVVMVVYMGRLPSGANDLSGAVDFETWQTHVNEASSDSLTNSSEITRPVAISAEKIKSWLSRNSALYNFILLRIGPLLRANRNMQQEISEAQQMKLEQGWDIFDHQLTYLQQLAEAKNFEVILVYIPEHSDLINHYDLISAKFTEIGQSHEFPLLDGYQLMLNEAAFSQFYYPLDGHLNSQGYDLFARKISILIAAQLSD